MDWIYAVIERILPFEWTQFVFMKNALIAILLVSPVFGLIGTMVVSHKMAFFSDAVGHSALTGIAIGVLLGFKSPVTSMAVFAILLALGVMALKNARIASSDTVIGVVSSTAVAAGVAVLSRSGGFVKYSA
jgi:zinc transport system permease protein